MARNGSGIYSAPIAGSYPAIGNTVISSTKFNTLISDIAAALTQSMSADGQTTVTADIPMSGHKHTGLSAGTANGDSVRYEQNALKLDAALSPDLNLLVNPDFRIWQTNVTEPTLSTNYVADCWGKHNGNTGRHVRNVLVASGTHSGDSEFSLLCTGDATATTSRVVCAQGILKRDSIPLRGKTVTFSGKVKFLAASYPGSGNWRALVGYSNTSNDGSFAVTNYQDVAVGIFSIVDGAYNTVFADFSVSVVVGASAQNICVETSFANLTDFGATDGYELSQLKLNVGSVATDFVPIPVSQELDRCLAFCEKSFEFDTVPIQNFGSGLGSSLEWRTHVGGAAVAAGRPGKYFIKEKRVAPTITLYNPNAANAQVRDITANVDCSASSALIINTRGFIVQTTGNAATAINNVLQVNWLATAFL